MLSEEYQEGKDAYYNSDPRSDNPYEEFSQEHDDWNDGWWDAEFWCNYTDYDYEDGEEE